MRKAQSIVFLFGMLIFASSTIAEAKRQPWYATWQACAKAYGLPKKNSNECCVDYFHPLSGHRWEYSKPCRPPN
jgi:hypothetical protein